MEERQAPWKQGDNVSHAWRGGGKDSGGGAIMIASLSSRASIGSRTIERLARQMPDAPIYRIGLQPGEPLYVPDTPNNREEPRAREPSRCLNWQSYGEILAKEAF